MCSTRFRIFWWFFFRYGILILPLWIFYGIILTCTISGSLNEDKQFYDEANGFWKYCGNFDIGLFHLVPAIAYIWLSLMFHFWAEHQRIYKSNYLSCICVLFIVLEMIFGTAYTITMRSFSSEYAPKRHYSSALGFIVLLVIFSVRNFIIPFYVWRTLYGNCSCELRERYELNHNRLLTRILKDDPLWNFVCALIERTWVYENHLGQDAFNLKHKRIKVIKIYHVENETLMQKYHGSCQEVNNLDASEIQLKTPLLTLNAVQLMHTISRLPSHNGSADSTLKSATKITEIPLGDIENTVNHGVPNQEASRQTSVDMLNIVNDAREDTSVDSTMNNMINHNEVYLFHGTPSTNIIGIVQSGLDVDKSERGLFGKGMYLAESSQKADQYPDKYGRRNKHLALFIVKTKLGKLGNHGTASETGANTVVAGHNKRFREFIVKDSCQMYPEFLVIYDRK